MIKIQCRQCSEVKPETEFYFYKNSNIVVPYCKACRSLKRKTLTDSYAERIESDEPEYRTCASCKQTLPASAFSIERGNKSGRRTCCRRCRSRKYAQKNKSRGEENTAAEDALKAS